MSEQTSQEPTMEEILASIRRIISEDEPTEAGAEAAPAAPEPEAVAEAAPPPPEPEPEPVTAVEPPPPPAPEPEPVMSAPEPEPEEEDDALELTQKVETMGDLDVLEPEPVAAPAAAPRPTLVSAPAAMAAATAFGALSAAIAMPRSDRTLEDVVRELLQPLLKQWLDDNLPSIVQQAVADEVERISRGRVG